MSDESRIILHIDMDAFYASVEQRDNPSYRGKPLIVGALPGHRGVVCAASYEARVFGIHSAMPISQAHRRCPGGIYVRPDMEKYARESCRIMAILESFSPLVEQVSVDEAFVDMTGTEKLWGDPLYAAKRIKGRIRDECGLTASIGIAPNKFLAKVGSDMNKPDGITEVPFDEEEVVRWLASLPVDRIWGVGKKTRETLERFGIRTVGDLQKIGSAQLEEWFGVSGQGLWNLCRGIDSREVGEGGPSKSISREHTFEHDTCVREILAKTILTLSQDVARTARKEGVKGSTVVLMYRAEDFNKHSMRMRLPDPASTATNIFESAVKLLDKLPPRKRIRLIGVGLAGFSENPQLDLFAGETKRSKWEAGETAIDRLLDKFGDGTVKRGGEV